MDLLGGIGLGSAPITSTPAAAAPKPTTDLLGDLFGGAPAASPVSAPSVSVDPLGDLLGGFGGPNATDTTGKSYQCYDKNGLRIGLVPTKEGTSLRIDARLENGGGVAVQGVVFQVAVPKVGFLPGFVVCLVCEIFELAFVVGVYRRRVLRGCKRLVRLILPLEGVLRRL